MTLTTRRQAIKLFSTSTLVVTVFVIVVGIIVWGLFKLYSLQPEPIVYTIMEIRENHGFIRQCADPNITVVQDVITEQIAYKCGKLGIISELITLYE